MATDNTTAWQDELALIEAVLKGYPSSIAKADALRAVRVLQATPPTAQPAPVQEPMALEEYDAGLLNDYGGGNVEWWQDYIRAELGRAYEHYQSQMATPPAAQRPFVGLTDEEIYKWWSSDNGFEDLDMCKEWDFTEVVRFIEAKLGEKNGGAA